MMLINPYTFKDNSTATALYSRSFTSVGYNGLIDAIGTNGSTISFSNPAAEAAGTTVDYPIYLVTDDDWEIRSEVNLFDQSESTYFTANPNPNWLVIDFGPGANVKLDHWGIQNYTTSYVLNDFSLQGSNDLQTWTDLDVVTGAGLGTAVWYDGTVSSSTQWRYLRFYSTDTTVRVRNIEFWGQYFAGQTPPNRSRPFVGHGYSDLLEMVGTSGRTASWTYPDDPSRTWPVAVSASSEVLAARGATTRAYSGGSNQWVSSSALGTWWKVDFGEDYQIVLDHYGIQAVQASYAPRNWKIQGSNNNTDWTDLDEQFNNSTLTADGQWVGAAVSSTEPWRYIRFLVTGVNAHGNYQGVFAYLALYGTHQDYVPPEPASTVLYTREFSTQGYNGLIDAIGTDGGTTSFVNPAAEADGGAIAHPAWTSISDQFGDYYTYGPFLATDQTHTTFSHSNSGGNHWWSIDFGQARSVTINHYAIRRRESFRAPANWVLEGSNDGQAWTAIDTQVANSTLSTNDWVDIAVTSSGPWQRLRISSSDSYQIIGDVEFYGDFNYDAENDSGLRQRGFSAPGYDDLFVLLATNDRTSLWNYPDDPSRNWPVSFSASSTYSGSYPARNATYRSYTGTNVFHSANAAGDWWQVDFGPDYQVVLDHYAIQGVSGKTYTDWRLQGSNDGTTWTDLSVVSGDSQISGGGDWSAHPVASTDAWRYIRVQQETNEYLVLAYVALYGIHQPVWTPATFGSDLGLWLDAQAMTGYADSDPITSWDDLSGYDNHALPENYDSSLTTGVVYRSNTVGGFPGVETAGNYTQLRVAHDASIDLAPEGTVYLVTVNKGTEYVGVIRNPSATNPGDVDMHQRGAYGLDNYSPVYTSTGWPANTTPNLVGMTWDDTTLTARLNGVQTATGSSNGGSTSTSNDWAIGGRSRAGFWAGGHYGEVILVKRALTPAETDLLEAYLSNKWGL